MAPGTEQGPGTIPRPPHTHTPVMERRILKDLHMAEATREQTDCLFTLYAANPGSILSIPYGPLSTARNNSGARSNL